MVVYRTKPKDTLLPVYHPESQRQRLERASHGKLSFQRHGPLRIRRCARGRIVSIHGKGSQIIT